MIFRKLCIVVLFMVVCLFVLPLFAGVLGDGLSLKSLALGFAVMLGAAIKSLDQASDKWVRRASVAGGDYQNGIQNPKRSWSEASKSAEGNYKTGVTAAANAGRYGKGVDRAGDARWKDMSAKKGPGRFAEGVAVGKDDWNKGFAPYHSAISALKLPDRGPRRSMQNYERSKIIGVTLGGLKEKTG